MAMDLANATFRGYRRENGRVGVRNHVIVLPVDDLSNAACEAVANNIKGAMAIPHPYGRLQFGADLELHFRTLIGTGANPNVAAVVVVGIEEGWTQRVVEGIAETGKPVTGYGIEMHGDHETVMRASKTAREYVQAASEAVREEAPLADLWVSTKCGESDTTSGCASNPARRKRLRQALPVRFYHGLRRDHGDHRGRASGRGTMPNPRNPRAVHVHVQSLPGDRRAAQDERPVGGRSRQRETSPAGSPPSRRRRSATFRRSAASAWSTASSTRRKRRTARACGSWIPPPPPPRW